MKLLRPRQAAVILSFSGRCRGESLGEGGTLLVAEAARRNEETTCITLVKKITLSQLHTTVFCKLLQTKVFRKLQAPFSGFYLSNALPAPGGQYSVQTNLLVLRIKLWKLTEYRRIVYLEPNQQLNFCSVPLLVPRSFATKCTGAHDVACILY